MNKDTSEAGRLSEPTFREKPFRWSGSGILRSSPDGNQVGIIERNSEICVSGGAPLGA